MESSRHGWHDARTRRAGSERKRKANWAHSFPAIILALFLIIGLTFSPLAPLPTLYAEDPVGQTETVGTTSSPDTSSQTSNNAPASDTTATSPEASNAGGENTDATAPAEEGSSSGTSSGSTAPSEGTTVSANQTEDNPTKNTLTTTEPEATAVPEATTPPVATTVPAETAVPAATTVPVVTTVPAATTEPAATVVAAATTVPEATTVVAATPAPEATTLSVATTAPEATTVATEEATGTSNATLDAAIPTESASATSSTTAESGDAVAAGVIADNELDNVEVVGGVSHGGGGTIEATNNYTGTVNQTGQAGAVTGFAGAIGGEANASVGDDMVGVDANAASGQSLTEGASATGSTDSTSSTVDVSTVGCSMSTAETTAASGDVAAVGVLADNSTNTTLVSSVTVLGSNYGTINVTNNSQTTIVNSGTGVGVSGQATSTGGNATATGPMTYTVSPTLSATAQTSTNNAASQTVTSPDSTVVGVEKENTLSETESINGTLTGIVSPNTATITQTGSINNQGTAIATTDAATATATGDANSNGSGAGKSAEASSTTTATSGDATAVGVLAQNDVSHTAVTNVRVEGSNFSVINVVVTSIVEIVNSGTAMVKSGIASATGGDATSGAGAGNGSGTAEAQSGDASATGVKANNSVSASNDTSIVIDGDNMNPLTIVIDVFVGIFNQGKAVAKTGNATADASGVANASSSDATAESGSADAVGVDAVNNVDLQSKIDVLVKGSNYAPINITVRLITWIRNIGTAEAKTGKAEAIGGPVTASASEGSPGAASAGSNATSSDNNSTNNTSQSTANLVQDSASNNGASTIISGAFVQLQSLVANALSTTEVKSGDAIAVGNAGSTQFDNTQVAIAGEGPGTGTTVAKNNASFYLNTSGTSIAKSGNAATGTIVDPGAQQSTDPGKSASRRSSGSIGMNFVTKTKKSAPWPYPWGLGMPGLHKTQVAGKFAPVYSFSPSSRISKLAWASKTLPRPEGWAKWLAREVPLQMPDAVTGIGNAKPAAQTPSWLQILGLAVGAVSVTGFTGYRYRRQLMPLLSSMFSTLTALF